VDYWDYLGWKDTFGQKAFTDRQRVYNMNIPSKYTLVTPQMIFHGQNQIAGANRQATKKRLKDVAKVKPSALLAAELSGDTVAISIAPKGSKASRADVIIVTYQPSEDVKIKHGENAGRTVTYTNIVSSWTKIGSWDGRSKTSLTHELNSDHSAAVILQARNVGDIYAAETLN
jgi:hypothetical protein